MDGNWTILPVTLPSGRERAILERHENGVVVKKTCGWREEIDEWCRADGIRAKVLPVISDAEYVKRLETEWEEAFRPARPQCSHKGPRRRPKA